MFAPAVRAGLIAAALSVGCREGVPRSPDLQPPQSSPSYSDTAALFDFIVDVTADVEPPIIRPRYPEALRLEGIEGRVEVRFVVDTTGRVEPESIEIRSSSHRYFSDAVREALIQQKYLPASLQGQRVRQIVTQPFVFSLTH